MSEMKKRKDNILAEGEATGHAHRVDAEDFAIFDDGNKKILEIPNGAKVSHEEHKTIALPPGKYDVSIVKEFDHPEEEARNVRD